MRRLYFLLALVLLLSACHNDTAPPSYDEKIAETGVKSRMIATETGEQSESGEYNVSPGKFLIKTADIKLRVKDVKQVAARIKNILGNYGAYIQSEEYNYSEYGKSYELTIRVPAGKFDSLAEKLEGFGKLLYKSISTQDVTARVIDLEARLENKKQTEKQYRELLKKCKTVSEILDVNEHLRQVREEIEATEARLKYYKTQAAYSTIYLTLVEPEKQNIPGFNFLQSLRDALLVSWQIFLYLLIVVIASLPFAILGYAVYLVVKYFRNRRRSSE